MPQLFLPDVFSGSEVKTFGALKPAKKTPNPETGFLAALRMTLSRNGNEEDSPETALSVGVFMGKTVDAPAPEGVKEIEVEQVKKEKTFFTGLEEATVMEGGYLVGLFPAQSPPDDTEVMETLRVPDGQLPEKEQTAGLFGLHPENSEDVILEEEQFAGEMPEGAVESGNTPENLVHADATPVDGQGQTGEEDSDSSVAVTKQSRPGTAEGAPESTVVVSEQGDADSARLKAAGKEKNTEQPETVPNPTAGKKTSPNPAPKTTLSAREGSNFYHPPPPDTVAGLKEEMSPPEGLTKPAGTRESPPNMEQETLVSLETVSAQDKKQGAERVEKLEAGVVGTFAPTVENVPVEQEKADPVNRFLSQEKVFGQILQGARMMVKNGAARVRLQLQPPELGRLELALVIEKETVTARFTAQSRTVQALIEANLPELRSNLQDAGLHVDQLQVEVENGFDSHQHSASGGLPQEETSSVRKMPDSYSPVYNDPESETGEEKWIGRINFRV